MAGMAGMAGMTGMTGMTTLTALPDPAISRVEAASRFTKYV